MGRTKEVQWRRILLAGVMTMGMVLLLVLFAGRFSMISHAESAAKVTATTANIRTEPSSTSTSIGSTEKDKVISIKSQVTGADGYTWYEVYVNADTLGYIRSDLVQITDGSTPPTGTGAASSTPKPTQAPATQVPDEPLVEVTAVNPASAEVTGGDSVRIRQNASTTSRILNQVKSGMALTITGTATGKDGKTWYQVTLINNGTEVTGFIRSDYTTVKPEELTPYTEEPPAEENPPEEEPSAEDPAPEETGPYDVIMQNGEWGLVDYEGAQGTPQSFYEIQQLFDGVNKNGQLLAEANKTVKTQKIIIILLVILLVAAAAAVTMLIFKVKDMTDAQYFNEVESETIRRRGTRPQGSGQRTAQSAGGRTAGTRPAGTVQGQRSQGSRPAGTSQGARPQGSRPAGVPQGQKPQGSRPAGTAQGQKPQGARPVNSQGQQPGTSQGQQRPAAQGARPSGASQGQQRPASQGQRPQGSRPAQQSAGWQSKNFMADEDEFEFEFLNYDGDDQK